VITRSICCAAALSMCCLLVLVPARAEPAKPKSPVLPPGLDAQTRKAIDRGLAYLRSKQDKDGGWTAMYGPAVTAIVAQAFAQNDKYGPQHPIVRRAVAGILRYQQSDGGLYDRTQNLANYQTSVALTLLASLDDPQNKERVAKAQAFLTQLQFDENESVDKADAWYGGAGYNEAKRPDLSNTQMMLEALHQSGLPKDHPVYQRALRFVSRCQLNEATNDLPLARGFSSGGFIYSPNAGGESKASEKLEEGQAPLRAYGTMTYAGFKSMIYASVARDDPRITASLKWIGRHYTLDENPNMPGKQSAEGLYYYYHVFARALNAWGEPLILDAKGAPHNWRRDLCRKLVSLQREDGSWVNTQPRWLEGDPDYVTGLTVLTLQTALIGSETPAKSK